MSRKNLYSRGLVYPIIKIFLIWVLLALTILLILMFAESARALEKNYQKSWCASMGGQMEVVLEDKSRVDCVTDEYAVEVEYAKKWAESIGQSLYYATVLDKKPGILIIKKAGDERFIKRLNVVAEKYGIKVWEVDKF